MEREVVEDWGQALLETEAEGPDVHVRPKKTNHELEAMHQAKAFDHLVVADYHRVRLEQESAHMNWHYNKAAEYARHRDAKGIL